MIPPAAIHRPPLPRPRLTSPRRLPSGGRPGDESFFRPARCRITVEAAAPRSSQSDVASAPGSLGGLNRSSQLSEWRLRWQGRGAWIRKWRRSCAREGSPPRVALNRLCPHGYRLRDRVCGGKATLEASRRSVRDVRVNVLGERQNGPEMPMVKSSSADIAPRAMLSGTRRS